MKINENEEIVQRIREELKANGGFCPCLLEQNEDTKCPCLAMRKQKECICGLYVNK